MYNFFFVAISLRLLFARPLLVSSRALAKLGLFQLVHDSHSKRELLLFLDFDQVARLANRGLRLSAFDLHVLSYLLNRHLARATLRLRDCLSTRVQWHNLGELAGLACRQEQVVSLLVNAATV